MELKVFRQDGSETGRTVTLDESIFAAAPNDHAIWLDVKATQANMRQGTHQSKERSESAHSTRTLYRQKDFVDELTAIARDLDIHIHLVHHIKKPDDESKVPGRYDAKGAGEISDQVDNVFMVWRNRPKEALEERQAQGATLTPRAEEVLNAPDVLIACDKQRNGDWEGRIALWFHKASLQYCGDRSRRPMELLR